MPAVTHPPDLAFEVRHDDNRCAAIRRDGQGALLGKLLRERGRWYWCPVRRVNAKRAMFDFQDAPLDVVLGTRTRLDLSERRELRRSRTHTLLGPCVGCGREVPRSGREIIARAELAERGGRDYFSLG